MIARRRRSLLAPLGVTLALLGTMFVTPVAGAGPISTLRLFVANSRITVERHHRNNVFVDPGAWIAPVGGSFELVARRPDYDHPIGLTQVDASTGDVQRVLPAGLLDGWFGMKDFVHYSIVDADGKPLRSQTATFCPNSYNRQRVSDDGPLISTYPISCGGGPFTRGSVWGIDDGWASSFVGDYYGLNWRAPEDRYTIRLSIDRAWVHALGLDPAQASAEVKVTVVDRGGRSHPAARPARPSRRRSPMTPITTSPDPATLPDLVALPGWGMSVYHRKGRDFLAFNATEWNAGPGTMVVEGFRGPDEDVMEAFQYFLVEGEPVGRAAVDELQFHAGGGHDHWHFEQFTRYTLLDTDRTQVTVSTKQSWCLANTDAIDMTLPGANWQGYTGGLFTSCGGPGALWIREILDVGWGDTYSQYVSGQAFDITDLPNGRYFVRTTVNPLGALYEGSSTNNVEDRRVLLKGRPGKRRVVVPPWHGIDTEGYCDYC